MIRAGLASIPARERSLGRVVKSLLPQVDRLGVYLNGYADVPEFLADPRIDVVRSQDEGDRGDAGKVFWSGAGDFDYYFTCDDDIVYPKDYTKRMVAAVDGYCHKAIVGLHGAILKDDPADYYRSRDVLFHNFRDVDVAHSVHVIATSSLCWHRSLEVTPDLFTHPNMADMWISAWANEHDIPRVVIPHAADWLRPTKVKGGTIWDASRRRKGGAMDTSEIQGRIARETAWKVSPLPSPVGAQRRASTYAVVSVITYQREEPLRLLLDDIERERKRIGGEVEVRIYDDASSGYEGIRELCRERGYAYFCAPEHYDKRQHWRLVTQELDDLRDRPADWYVFLPDDARLCTDFFARAAAVWETLEDPCAMNLTYHLTRPGSCWTHVEPRDIGDGVENGWIDGLYICRRDLLDRLDYRVPVESQEWVDAWLDRCGSTGVGKTLSQALVDAGARLYRVKRSLVIMQDVPSIMHTKRRVAEPQTAVSPVAPFRPTASIPPRAVLPTISVAMMAHPKRKAQVDAILARLDRDDVEVVWDEKNNRWDTGRRAMLAYDPECSHHAVIQDDVLVCRDLFAGVQFALAHVPDDVPVCGYVGRVRPFAEMVTMAAAVARGRGASWLRMHTLNWGPLIIVPTAHIPAMIEHCDTLTDILNYDRRLSRYWETVAKVPTWYTWPSLVDHDDGPSLIQGRIGTDRRKATHTRVAHTFIGEESSALDVDWSGISIDAENIAARGKVVLRHRKTGQELRLPVHSPRVRRLRGLPSWEMLVDEVVTA